ncbi:MAG: DUF2007 domain-containing protein [Bacteroidales bacterium]|nr:DUF2007 domain-containing protein [Bacteroidales bacterium]
MKEEIMLVYTGSEVEAMYIVEILNENGIGAMKHNRLRSSIDAGWADGSPEDAVQVFVEDFNFEKASKILEEYFKSRDVK